MYDVRQPCVYAVFAIGKSDNIVINTVIGEAMSDDTVHGNVFMLSDTFNGEGGFSGEVGGVIAEPRAV